MPKKFNLSPLAIELGAVLFALSHSSYLYANTPVEVDQLEDKIISSHADERTDGDLSSYEEPFKKS